MQEAKTYKKRRNNGKCEHLRAITLIYFLLCFSTLHSNTQWHKHFHLDEMPELSRAVLEVLRQPLEDRTITISRAKYNVEYPYKKKFTVICSSALGWRWAMNS